MDTNEIILKDTELVGEPSQNKTFMKITGSDVFEEITDVLDTKAPPPPLQISDPKQQQTIFFIAIFAGLLMTAGVLYLIFKK